MGRLAYMWLCAFKCEHICVCVCECVSAYECLHVKIFVHVSV